MADRPMRADRSIRPEQRARFDARTYEAQQVAKVAPSETLPVCERCGGLPALHFIPDRTRGWDRPRRLCAACCGQVLDQRRSAAGG